jgi:DNA-binding response OmpR family regulator
MNSANKKILIIEDEEDLREMYGDKVKSAGYQVLTANCGDDGLKLIRSEKPDLIILDLIMPRKNGFDVMEEIKKDKTMGQMPIIVLSNLCQDDDKNLAKELGAADYLIKSQIRLEDLVNIVNNFFK